MDDENWEKVIISGKKREQKLINYFKEKNFITQKIIKKSFKSSISIVNYNIFNFFHCIKDKCFLLISPKSSIFGSYL